MKKSDMYKSIVGRLQTKGLVGFIFVYCFTEFFLSIGLISGHNENMYMYFKYLFISLLLSLITTIILIVIYYPIRIVLTKVCLKGYIKNFYISFKIKHWYYEGIKWYNEEHENRKLIVPI